MGTLLTTDREYRTALDRVKALFESDPDLDSPDGRELDALVALVEEYENRVFPIDVFDPVDDDGSDPEEGGEA